MRRGTVQSEGSIRRETSCDDNKGDNSQRPLGDLDLLNLRLTLSADRRKNCDSGDSNNVRLLHKGNYQHVESNYHCLPPQGYANFTDKKCNQVEDLFLLPPRKRNSCEALKSSGQVSSAGDTGNSFPFRTTPSGNLKVKSQQLVFESKKLSVLVSDPQRTKIDFITANPNERKAAYGSGEFAKNSAMDAILSQAGISVGLGSIIGETPVRTQNKVASEYESKQTSEILDPELNLCRLGYTGSDPIDWTKVTLPDKKDLYLELCRRITNKKNADCKVHIGREEFSCHLIVLQCYSELFDSYIAIKKVEIPSDKCSATSFAFIYDWMVSEEQSHKYLNRENVLDIFNSAKYLKIKDLVEQCWAFVDNADVFTEDTAFLLYVDAKAKNLEEVRELMVPRIQDFFLILVSSQDWLELSVEDVKNLLSSNYIRINCEMEVFMSAVRWLKADWGHREKYRYEVLQCVRFGNIAPWQLVDIKRNPENPEFMELARDPAICKLVDDGLAFVIIKYWYGQENEDFQHWNSVLGLQEPPERHWSGMDKTYFTYREFLIYLDQYRRNQLIEKSKPRNLNDKKLGSASGTAVPPEQPSHSMEDFLVKKKVAPLTSPFWHFPKLKSRKCGVSEWHLGSKSPKSPASDSEKSSASRSGSRKSREKSRRPDSKKSGKLDGGSSRRFWSPGPKFIPPGPTPTSPNKWNKPYSPSLTSVVDDKKSIGTRTSKSWHPRAIDPGKPEAGIETKSGGRDKTPTVTNESEGDGRSLMSADKDENKELKRNESKFRIPSTPKFETLRYNIKKLAIKSVISSHKLKTTASGTSKDDEDIKKPQQRSRTAVIENLRAAVRDANNRRISSKHLMMDTGIEEEMRNSMKLFSESKTYLAKVKFNQLSASVLGPTAKNYLREGSLFANRIDTILVFGGIDPHLSLSSGKNIGQSVLRYDAESNRWDHIGNLPEPRHHHCVAFMNGRVYLVGGVDPRNDDIRGKEAVKGTMWSFDPVNKNWFSETSMKELRKNFGLVVSKRKMYAFGGINNQELAVATMERYDALNDTWDFMSPMKHARGGLAYTKHREHIWAAGGIANKNSSSRNVSDVVECYNIDENQWTRITRLRLARCFSCLFVISDRLYLIGGAGKNFGLESSSSLADVDIWDNSLMMWRKITELSVPRHGHSVAYVGPQIFILGGFTTYYMRTLKNSECYCTKRGAWVKGIASLPVPISGHASLSLPPAYLVSGRICGDI